MSELFTFSEPRDIPIRNRVTHLDNTHRKPCLLGKLFPYMSGGFRGLVECGLQNFELFGFYGGSWSSSFGASRAVFIFIALGIIINITINRTWSEMLSFFLIGFSKIFAKVMKIFKFWLKYLPNHS